ncbi:imm11 family protein [Paenibacillus durus]|uniref:Immunity MXAN-0049 protein domain-containing protein n=1 Tax=Paenibacillus durus ATCC 35681 TaxID=1333534 RepID=A0A0F7F7D9_PAEDU|nr:hypothetical protein [Paenibacillus durus]AKG33343.1 hypothetical protein VK70_00890 [Paenibacillus durus ATCC 35681]
MRHYYVLLDDSRISRNIEPLNIGLLNTPFVRMVPAQVLDVHAKAETEYTDWLPFSASQPLLSDPMKRILELYNTQARFKQMYIVDREYKRQELYWIPHVPDLDVISEHTEYYPHNQTLKHLVLDSQKVRGHHFFRLSNVREPYFIVSLDAAESLLRRGLSGFRLQKVELSHEEA